jgi:hypothetical protein
LTVRKSAITIAGALSQAPESPIGPTTHSGYSIAEQLPTQRAIITRLTEAVRHLARRQLAKSELLMEEGITASFNAC